jgi:hypothetical protein
MEGNIRIYRLPKGRVMDHDIDISLSFGSGKLLIWRAISGYTDCPRVVVRTSENDLIETLKHLQ